MISRYGGYRVHDAAGQDDRGHLAFHRHVRDLGRGGTAAKDLRRVQNCCGHQGRNSRPSKHECQRQGALYPRRLRSTRSVYGGQAGPGAEHGQFELLVHAARNRSARPSEPRPSSLPSAASAGFRWRHGPAKHRTSRRDRSLHQPGNPPVRQRLCRRRRTWADLHARGGRRQQPSGLADERGGGRVADRRRCWALPTTWRPRW